MRRLVLFSEEVPRDAQKWLKIEIFQLVAQVW